MLKYNSLKLKLTQVYFKYDRNREEGRGVAYLAKFVKEQRVLVSKTTKLTFRNY